METRTVNPLWRKSSYSTGNGGQCVEAGHVPGAVLVRDTTDRSGITLLFTAAAWATFLTAAKLPTRVGMVVEPQTVGPSCRKSSYSANGGQDCVEVADAASAVLVRDTKDRNGAALTFTAAAWAAFLTAVR